LIFSIFSFIQYIYIYILYSIEIKNTSSFFRFPLLKKPHSSTDISRKKKKEREEKKRKAKALIFNSGQVDTEDKKNENSSTMIHTQ
jgi:hypothetical protein